MYLEKSKPLQNDELRGVSDWVLDRLKKAS